MFFTLTDLVLRTVYSDMYVLENVSQTLLRTLILSKRFASQKVSQIIKGFKRIILDRISVRKNGQLQSEFNKNS